MLHLKLVSNFFFLCCFFFVTFSSCNSKDEPPNSSSKTEEIKKIKSPNVLLIITDDMGLDTLNAYQFPNDKPNTPNIDSLAQNGITFSNFWSAPTCSPTRASLLTGKYGFRTGVLKPGNLLNKSEISLHELLLKNNPSYKSIVIGKWHLSGHSPADYSSPNDLGIADFRGYLSGEINYTNWKLIQNGKNLGTQKTYSTTKFTDIAIDWIKEKEDNPWFLWLAYNAAHTPLHLPPIELHSKKNLSGTEQDIADNPRPYFYAMIEALDSNIGRLLNSIPTKTKEKTIIIFMGDNGTSRNVIGTYRKAKSKGTVYEGGMNVPLIIGGANINKKNIQNGELVHVVDLFATILDLTETKNITQQQKQDSKSFKHILTGASESSTLNRELNYNQNDTAKTIRNKIYKLIKNNDNSEEFYHLVDDPYENKNLIENLSDEQKIIKNNLSQKLGSLLGN